MLEIKQEDIEITDKGDTIEYHHRPSDLHYECYKTVTNSNDIFHGLVERSWWPTSRIDQAVRSARVICASAVYGIGVRVESEEHKANIFAAIRGLEYHIDQSRAHKALADDLACKLWDTQEKLRELEGTLQAAQAKVLSLQEEVRQAPAWYRRGRNLLFIRLRGRRGIETTGTTPMVPDP